MTRRHLTLILAAGAMAIGLGACSDMGRSPAMTIVNRTDLPVEVTIVGEPAVYEELPKVLSGGGGMMLLAGPIDAGDKGCIRGTLVATRGGQTIATIDHPCAGSRWEIIAAAPS
jgi:hypothetical protein